MRKVIGLAVICFIASGQVQADSARTVGAVGAIPVPARSGEQFAHTYLLHLPGIAGARGVDRMMTSGLRDGGYTGPIETYDWTGQDPGLRALMAYDRNQVEAQKIAERITERFRADPTLKIIITAHSGGTGLAVWALEKLPADVKVEQVLLLSSALSPQYDLSKALSHVRGKCYSFFSENDVLVLGAGTKLFGTIDGKKCESAGECGFILPETADLQQYQKLIQKPYDKVWMQYGNIGDHIGTMRRPFAANVLTPLLLEKSHPQAAAMRAQDQAKSGQRIKS